MDKQAQFWTRDLFTRALLFCKLQMLLVKLVGARGFEPPTTCTPYGYVFKQYQ